MIGCFVSAAQPTIDWYQLVRNEEFT